MEKIEFKRVLLPFIVISLAGCSTLQEYTRANRLAAEKSMTEGRLEQAQKVMDKSLELCEQQHKDKPESNRQEAVDICVQYVYTSVMQKVSSAEVVSNSNQKPVINSVSQGQKVYRADECIGAIVNGVCHGSVIPKGYTPTCYGTMLNGQCTGPMF